ncbi:MAG TPA: type II toxin-antitoxin system antitoxin SocA domain-containing protein [Allosphingosinicella sp.]|jgi:uncharacterized phage-associated protein
MSGSAPYDAREVSNFILRVAKEQGRELTQMALLKIVYYAHGWYLASFREPLVRQPIEAWEHGPVVKVVRDAFKSFGKKPITSYAERVDLETGEIIAVSSRLAEKDEKFVREIFQQYARYDALTLSDMTHERNSPWDRVWNTTEPVGRLGLRIRNEEIRNHFLSLRSVIQIH